ncbi:MAG: iron ABC transporter permease [Candidatus Aminicenantes bacterium]|nr:iron ABC transporter permease [Candidatus Aminicenantes bacterium]
MNGFAKRNKKATLLWLAAVLLPLLLVVVSLNIGAYHIPLRDVWRTLTGAGGVPGAGVEAEAYRDILFRIRLPRLILALAIGAALSVSGAALQAIFRNPLVNEYILGISFGAAFGAAVSVIFLGRVFPPQPAAFLTACCAVLLVLAVAGRALAQPVSLILTGVIVSALFQALLSLAQFLANPYALQAIVFWLMGSLADAGWKDLAVSLPIMVGGTAILLLLRWRLNVLSLGDEEAKALGINVRREKLLVILAATLTTAAATAVVGVIGWVGLIVPHLVRMMAGADNRRVLPLSALFGASLMLLADDVARAATSFEIPIGILTSVVGIPFFIFLLKKSRQVWL